MTNISLTEEQEIEFVCALTDRIEHYKKLMERGEKPSSEENYDSYQRDIDICVEMLKQVGFEYVSHAEYSKEYIRTHYH